MPEDLTPNHDELSATTSATGPGTTNEAPPIPVRPPAEPRAYESLTDGDPADAAGNADDATEAS